MLGVRPIYYASYRDIYDALISSRLRVSTDFMHDFLRVRGVILANQASREELVDAIATYAYESADLDELCDQLEVHSKADRVTHIALNKAVTADVVKAALHAVHTARENRHESVEFKHADGGRLEVSVDYYELDEGRTLLRQQRPKHGKIELMSTASGMRMRYPGAERVSDVAMALLAQIETAVPEIKHQSIDLGAFNKLQRTRFFQLLIQKFDGYKPSNVRKVNVNQEIYEPVFASDEEEHEGSADDADDNGAEEPSSADKREVEKEVKSYLKRATLDGSGILQASELRRFLESGFFISRIVWEAQPRSKKDGKPKAELEALLERPAEGLGFKYTVRGVYSRRRDKRFATTKRKAKDTEREELLDALEVAAQTAYAEVTAEIENAAKVENAGETP